MKYTAQQIKRSLIKNKPDMLNTFKVIKYDREYQVWKREPLSIELLNKSMFKQKLEYIHYNPVRAGLCSLPEEYYYSSAKLYIDGTNSFGMLKHYSGNYVWLLIPLVRDQTGAFKNINFNKIEENLQGKKYTRE